jgi:hypothetical protein
MPRRNRHGRFTAREAELVRDLAAAFLIALLDYFLPSHLSLIYAKKLCVPAFGDATNPGRVLIFASVISLTVHCV